jgi:hypothetical protein
MARQIGLQMFELWCTPPASKHFKGAHRHAIAQSANGNIALPRDRPAFLHASRFALCRAQSAITDSMLGISKPAGVARFQGPGQCCNLTHAVHGTQPLNALTQNGCSSRIARIVRSMRPSVSNGLRLKLNSLRNCSLMPSASWSRALKYFFPWSLRGFIRHAIFNQQARGLVLEQHTGAHNERDSEAVRATARNRTA